MSETSEAAPDRRRRSFAALSNAILIGSGMLSHETALQTLKHMASYGERGTAGAQDPDAARVQGPPVKKLRTSGAGAPASAKPARIWDDNSKTFIHP